MHFGTGSLQGVSTFKVFDFGKNRMAVKLSCLVSEI